MANYLKISVKPDTKKLFSECYDVFLSHNPDCNDLYLSEDFMMKRICNAYLDKL